MTHWLERGADGWRMDAAYAVPPAFWRRVLPGVRERFPEVYVVGEVIHGDYAGYVRDSTIDSVTQYELWKAIWSSLNDGNFYELAWSLERHDGYVRAFAPLTFVGNHDVTRIASKLNDPRHLGHALVVLLTIGGTPSIYYGDEQGFTGSKEERFGGDDAVRPEFPQAGPAALSQLGRPILQLHQQLIGMRRRHPWLHRATTTQVELANEQFVYRVAAGEAALLVALNLADEDHEVPLGSAHVEVETSSPSTGVNDQGTVLVVGPHEWAVLAPAR
jgi:cyclomaltodextrinase